MPRLALPLLSLALLAAPAAAQTYTIVDLGTLGGTTSQAHGINAKGWIVGESLTKESQDHAFLWDGKEMHDLGTLGGSFSAARGVNANDVVVGWAYLATGMFHAYAGGPSGLVDLGTLGGSCSAANAVNDAGAACGYAYLEGNQKLHACLWIGGKPRDLGVLTASASEALALNGDASTVVGRAPVLDGTCAISTISFR